MSRPLRVKKCAREGCNNWRNASGFCPPHAPKDQPPDPETVRAKASGRAAYRYWRWKAETPIEQRRAKWRTAWHRRAAQS